MGHSSHKLLKNILLYSAQVHPVEYTAEFHSEITNTTTDKGSTLWNLANEGDVQGVIQFVDAITSLINRQGVVGNKTDNQTDDKIIKDRQKVRLAFLKILLCLLAGLVQRFSQWPGLYRICAQLYRHKGSGFFLK